MPNIIQAPNQQFDILGLDFDYKYPEGIDLSPHTLLHNKLVEEVLFRARESNHYMKQRRNSWDQIERTLTAFVPEKELKDAKKKGDKTPPIIIPVSYANLETLLTYMVATFLQDPIFRYEGVGPEDKIGTILLEKVIALQCLRASVGLQLHTMWRDGFAYGFGAAAPIWYKEMGMKTVRKQTGFFSELFEKFVGTGFEEEMEEYMIFEGNRLENIHPRVYLPDPNYSIHEVQKGEYVGWVDTTNFLSLLGEENNSEDFFNVKYLKGIKGNAGQSIYGKRVDSGRSNTYERTESRSIATNPIDVIFMYINLIPADLEIGDGEVPEKWLFALAADQVIIKAKPLGLDHGRYPIVTCAPDFDGYSITPISRLEISYGLQETIDFIIGSHIANVRKAVNDVIVVDPWMINVKDLANPEPGKIVRTRRQMWGKGIEGAFKQLKISDITRENIRDAMYLTEITQKVTGATDIVSGVMQTKGERRSATEARGAQQGGLARLEKAAKIISMQSMQDLAFMFASHTQQLMEESTYVKITGRWEEDLRKEYGYKSDRAPVKPSDLSAVYDVVPHDGSMPGREPADLWVQLFQVLASNPEVAQEFDLIRVFRHLARQLGAKNVEDFIKRRGPIQTQILPDEEVDRKAKNGEILPVDQI